MGDMNRVLAGMDVDALLEEMGAGLSGRKGPAPSNTPPLKAKAEAGPITEPPALVKSLAAKAGVSAEKAEGYWEDAKAAAKKAHPDVAEDSDRFYQIVTGYLKKMLGLADSAPVGGPEQVMAEVKALCGRIDRLCRVLERLLGTEEAPGRYKNG